jgi:hypothetical protein
MRRTVPPSDDVVTARRQAGCVAWRSDHEPQGAAEDARPNPSGGVDVFAEDGFSGATISVLADLEG